MKKHKKRYFLKTLEKRINGENFSTMIIFDIKIQVIISFLEKNVQKTNFFYFLGFVLNELTFELVLQFEKIVLRSWNLSPYRLNISKKKQTLVLMNTYLYIWPCCEIAARKEGKGGGGVLKHVSVPSKMLIYHKFPNTSRFEFWNYRFLWARNAFLIFQLQFFSVDFWHGKKIRLSVHLILNFDIFYILNQFITKFPTYIKIFHTQIKILWILRNFRQTYNFYTNYVN